MTAEVEASRTVTLVPWTDADLAVLERANTPAMTLFLGGPESADELAQRHAEYLAFAESGEGGMFRVEVGGDAVGYAGWWTEEHEGAPVCEIGCAVEPAWQGRGVATEALGRVVDLALAAMGRPVVGYSDIGNAASSALCRRVGFELRGRGVFPSDDGDIEVDVWIIEPGGRG
ncbi:GNAT family N-acetyltransferase [Microbacterium sp. 4R-513]|uniref:GNAT family N-acetyltransferase n=1 Tax=Microbacterium sp. 4R-513 TaxID=2567934 RepID=UPI0013E17BFB|nr:GNAT family N-acetyltransferase [Microbacterium sp. 4R-513]QIG38826.1 GNAT family N-acetyltransferase [Microbacterium sp. 4R-513]